MGLSGLRGGGDVSGGGMLSGDVVWPPTCPVTTVVVVVVVAGGGGGGGARCPRSEVTAQGEMAAGPCGWSGGRAGRRLVGPSHCQLMRAPVPASPAPPSPHVAHHQVLFSLRPGGLYEASSERLNRGLTK